MGYFAMQHSTQADYKALRIKGNATATHCKPSATQCGENFSLSLVNSLFSSFARRKFIKFTRKFTNSRHFLTKFIKFINFYFYGLPRLAFARLAMTTISTQHAFKILKNSTQRSQNDTN